MENARGPPFGKLQQNQKYFKQILEIVSIVINLEHITAVYCQELILIGTNQQLKRCC